MNADSLSQALSGIMPNAPRITDNKPRKSGIEIIGDIPWGTHICLLYNTRENILDILIPYFAAGLKNNEFCIWVTSQFLPGRDAELAMRNAVPDFDQYLKKGQIEFIPATEWYIHGHGFDSGKILSKWGAVLDEALSAGYDGMRLSGDISWFGKEDWSKITTYEKEADGIIGNHSIIAVCTYPLDKCGSNEVIDIVNNHQIILTKREDTWSLLGNSRYKAVQRAVRENEQRYRTLLDTMTEGFALHEIIRDERGLVIDYRFLDINPAFEQETGLKREDVVGRTMSAVLPGNDPHWIHFFGKVALTGEPLHLEEYSSALNRYYEVFAYRPAPCYFATFFKDITQRKLTEKKLGDREKILHLIMDSTPALISYVDSGYRYHRVNKNYERWFGHKTEEMQGSHVRDVLGEQAWEVVRPYMEKALTGETVSFEHKLPYRDGGPRWVHVTYTPYFDETSCVQGFMVHVVDIEKIKKSENALRASEERFKLLADISELLLITEDPQMIIEQLCGIMMIHLDCQAFFNYLSDDTENRLHLNAYAGIPDEEVRRIEWLDYGVSVCGCVARGGKRIIAEDILSSQDQRTQLVRSYGIQAYCCHPLLAQGKLIGTLSFGTKTRTSFAADEISLMRTVSDQVAIAMHRIQTQKALKKALSEAEEGRRTLEALMEYVPEGITIADAPDARIRMVSRYGRDILGETHVGLTAEDAARRCGVFYGDGRTPVPDDDLPLMQAIRQGKVVRNTEIVQVNAAGERLPLLFNAAPIHDSEGSIKGGIVTWRDITELKEAHETLQKVNESLEERVKERTEKLMQATLKLEEQKEILQKIFDKIPIMIIVLDPAGAIRLMNRELERTIGWSLEEAQNENILAVCYPDPDAYKEALDYIWGTKSEWRDFVLTTRSGNVISSSWIRVRLSDGSLIGIGIDTSARKKMEQELLRLATAIEQAGEGIVLFSPEGIIEYANPAYEILSGHKRDELIGKTPWSFAPETDVDYRKLFDCIRTEGRTWTGRKSRKRCTGDVLEVDMSVSPVNDTAGRIINFVAVIRDITQETILQKHLSQAQKMEAIGTLAGGIAHDLKNIFTPILINTEIAIEDTGEESPIRPLLKEVLEATRLGVELVKQIVTFSRKAPPVKKPVAVSSIIREGLNFIRAALPATVEIRIQITPNRAMILADPTQIKQVLINLANNAAYAMKEQGGIMEVHLLCLSLDAKEVIRISPDLTPGTYVQITVRDTGHGMDQKTINRIFEPFFTTKKNEGTGMGLAIVHAIVKDHHGAVTVRSRAGKGSTFNVYLPKLLDEPI